MFDNFFIQGLQDAEFMPVLPIADDAWNDGDKSKLPTEIPIIALRNTVLFPDVVLPITVAREKSVDAMNLQIRIINGSGCS